MANDKMTRANALEMAKTAIQAYADFSDEDKATAIEKVNKLIADVTRPRSKSDEPTEKQKVNIELKNIILGALANAEKPMAIADIMALDERFGSAPQKATTLLTQLKKGGKVVRVEGRKATYKLV